MKFWEAMKCLQEGKKVRKIKWDAGSYWNLRSMQHWVIHLLFEDIEEEWEIYEEPCLNFSQVMDGLKEGKKYRRRTWANTNYYIFIGTLKINVLDINNEVYRFYLEDVEQTDWEEVK